MAVQYKSHSGIVLCKIALIKRSYVHVFHGIGVVKFFSLSDSIMFAVSIILIIFSFKDISGMTGKKLSEPARLSESSESVLVFIHHLLIFLRKLMFILLFYFCFNLLLFLIDSDQIKPPFFSCSLSSFIFYCLSVPVFCAPDAILAANRHCVCPSPELISLE